MMRCLLVLILLSFLGYPLSAAEKPNIIFILADDLGWGDLGCYGHPCAKTPNLDRLAAEGTRFTRFHATGVTCCPARTGLMTGRLPARFQKYPADHGFGDCVTVTELLKKHGYATGHFGKWHIGAITEPGTYGIDVIGDEGAKRRSTEGSRGRDAPMYDQAIRFMEQHKSGPFYINIWDHISHHPVNPTQAVLDAFGPMELDESKFSPAMREKFATCRDLGGDPAQHLRAFLADVKSMDDEIGRLLARVDELGLRENTLVVFSSDQGAAALRSDEDGKPEKQRNTQKRSSADIQSVRMNAMGCAGPDFRGGKHTSLEGGVCVPFIMRWPAKVHVGRIDDQSVLSGADWLPSLCGVTGITIKASDFDGEDSSSAWFGKNYARTKPLFWKTSAVNSDPSMLVQNWKLHGSNRRNGAVELYDLGTDPGERVNLAEKQPEVLGRLKRQLAAWVATLPQSYEKSASKED